MKISFVIPAWNEADSLPELRRRLEAVANRWPEWEGIVVSDGSTDTTAEIVEQWQAENPRWRLVRLSHHMKKSAALMAGLKAVTGDIVVTMDADLQDEPNEIPKFVDHITSGKADMVVGWKQNRHDPKIKVLSSKVFNGTANRIARTNFHDMNCGLKAFRREVIGSLDLYGDLYRFIPLIATADGWRVIETPVEHHQRKFGKSKYGLRFAGAFDLLTLSLLLNYRWRPLHFFGRWGTILALIGFGLLVYLAVLHFQGQTIGDRPLLIFAILFVLAGLQLFFTGLLGELILQHRRRS